MNPSLNTPEAVELSILTHELVNIQNKIRWATSEEYEQYPLAKFSNNSPYREPEGDSARQRDYWNRQNLIDYKTRYWINLTEL